MKLDILDVPVLVRYNGNQYEISHAFTGFTSIVGARFNEALSTFEQKFRKEYGKTIISVQTRSLITWLHLNPEITIIQPQLDFQINQQLVQQAFTAVTFYIDKKLVVVLPDFSFYAFIADESDPDDNPVEVQIERFIKSSLRSIAESSPRNFSPEPYKARRKEFITVVEIGIYINNHSPTPTPRFIFGAALNNQEQFDGREELARVGHSLNELYPHKLRNAYFSNEIVEKLAALLFERNFAAIALVGESGTGKTSMLHQALHQYIHKTKDEEISVKKSQLREIHYIDPNHIISGMSVVGQWQKRLTAIIEAIVKKGKMRKSRHCDILYTDNPVAFFRVGQTSMNSMTLSNLIKPYIQKRRIPFIIEATPEEWRIVGQMDRSFTDLFQVIRVYEPAFEKTLRITAAKRIELEGRFSAKLNHDGLYKLFTLQRKYMLGNALPGSVVKQMERLAAKYNDLISNEKLDDEIRELTHIKQHQLGADVLNHNQMCETLQKKLIGQQDAVDALCNIIHVINADLNDPGKPMVSALFIGPTGVGKTQAAKVLAEYLFDSDDNLLRFDMNEFIDGGAVSRLIGDFYNPEGQLAGRIRHNPHCVLLFDEIEKANPDVLDLLLQVLGEGRLTDSVGRTVDFSNTIIIMTSNLGAENAGRELGYVKNEHSLSQIYKKAVENFFRPEMLNRIDEIVIFQRLKIDDIIAIANLLFAEILNREGFIRRTTIMKIHQNALKAVAERGFDPAMGARSLKRNIEKEVIELTAEYLTDIQSSVPIVLEIFLHDNKLVPRITPFVNEKIVDQPLLPEFGDRNRKKAYLDLFLEIINQIEDEIFDYREEFDENSDSATESILGSHGLLTLLDEIRKLRNRIEQRLYEIAQRFRYIPTPKNYYKLHGFRSLQQGKPNDHSEGQLVGDIHNQPQINEYFSEKFAQMKMTIEDDIADYTEFFIKLSYFQHFWEGFVNEEIDQFVIKIEPLKEIEGFTLNLNQLPFMRLWGEFQFIEPIKHENAITYGFSLVYVNGPGLRELLKHEEGLHMLLDKNNKFPVLVSIIELAEDFDIKPIRKNVKSSADALYDQFNATGVEMDKVPALNGKIVRYYEVNSSDSRNNLTTDLKTGTIGRGEMMTQQDAELIFSVNIPGEFKPMEIDL